MGLKQSKSRLEGFSDSVFAFAATLLVVSFEIPDSFKEFRELQIGFISFGVSFLALALLWKLHYNFFRRVNLIDNVIISLNMIFLFVILFYVFPLKFLANLIIGKSTIQTYYDLSYLFQIYGLGFVLTFLILSSMYGYASLKKNNLSNRLVLKYYGGYFLVFVFVGIISILLAYLGIGVKYGVPGSFFVLFGPFCYGYRKKFEKLFDIEISNQT